MSEAKPKEDVKDIKKDESDKVEEKKEEKPKETIKAIQVLKLEKDYKKNIKLSNIAKPTKDSLKDNEILVKVYSAGFNPVDWKIACGYVWPEPTPHILGFDYSGIIEAIGSKVDSKIFKIGSRVCGQITRPNNGTFAEYLIAECAKSVAISDKTPFNEAAALPLVSTTAYQVLFKKLNIKPDSKLLILGATSAVGLIALQLASNAGVKTITVTSSKEELCQKYGATQVINYRKNKYSDVLKGKDYDLCFDCVGEASAYKELTNVMKKNGIIVSIANMTKPDKLVNGITFEFYAWDGGKVGLKENLELYEKGKLKTMIDSVYGFSVEDVLKMIEKSMSGKVKGKLICEICK